MTPSTTVVEKNVLEEIVVTATRSDQPVQDITSNISTIDLATIQSVNHTHFNELAQRISGVWISRGNGQESLTAIRSPVLTGAGGCGAFLMSQDGIPLQAAGFCNVNELFGAHTETAGVIEVIKGPGSAVHGSNAMHGLVNVRTQAITDEEQTTLVLEGGPHDYQRLKFGHSENRWRIDASGTRDGGYKDNSGFDQQKFTVKAQGMLGSYDVTSTLSATNLNQETAGFIQGPEAYRQTHRKRENPNPEAFRDVSTARLNLGFHREIENDTELSITPYFRYVEMDFLQHFLPGQALEENGHVSAGIQNTWHQNKLIVGIDAEYTSGYLRESQHNPTTGSAFLMATIPAGKHYDYQVDATTIAGFAQYTHEFTKETKIIAGARYEYMNYDYDNKMINGRTRDDGSLCEFGGCRFNRPADRADTFNNFSPKIGLTHQFDDQQQLYLQLSHGFRAPQATELYRLQGSQAVTNIHSESLLGFEVGFRGDVHRLGYDFSLYDMTKDNVIFRDTSRMNVDNGETTHRGIELTLTARISQNLSGNLNVSLANHEYANNPALSNTPLKGNGIDTAPRTFGSANLLWQPWQQCRVELEWVHMGDYYTDPQNTAVYGGHNLLNVRAEMKIDQSWAIFFRLMNATDTDYAERADLGFGNHRYFVGEPRSIFLGVKVDIQSANQ